MPKRTIPTALPVPIPTAGYPSRTQAIRALLKDGKTPGETADKLGVELKMVQTIGGRSVPKYPRQRKPRTNAGASRVNVSDKIRTALLPYAAERNIDVNTLIRSILMTVVKSDLVLAVLDDEPRRTANARKRAAP